MAIVTTEEAEAVMKRCQRGTTGYDKANDLHAECYGTIGALVAERDRLRATLHKSEQIAMFAIDRAWNLGQEYSEQVNSEYSPGWKKSVDTANKYHALRADARAALEVSCDHQGESNENHPENPA